MTISLEELQLAARNHGMPLEALRYDVTPVGLHYLLTHFDIPDVDASAWRLEIGGHVERPLALSLPELQAREPVELVATMECAGNGRARIEPHVSSQPWLQEAVGTGVWAGTPLRPLLEEARPRAGAVDVVFAGLDRGEEGGELQRYERALALEDALAADAILAWSLNGAPLPPQHGFPLRLVVPGWYGMTNVKWLAEIAVSTTPFEGYQQDHSYRLRQAEEDEGEPITRMLPRALLEPPGVPEFFTRERRLEAGPCVLRGRAWSGLAPIAGVEVSTDGGASWAEAHLERGPSRWAWCAWRTEWDAQPGRHELLCRARDEAGNTQPVQPVWNFGGYVNNAVQRVVAVVS